MHRIDGDGYAPGNLFTEGDPQTNTPATKVTDDWLNASQEEMAGLIEGADIALSKNDNTQLSQAVATMATRENVIACGNCQVAQAPNIVAPVAGTWAFAPVDLGSGHWGMLNGATVAGTMTHKGDADFFLPAKYASHWSGVTLTGAGLVYERVRLAPSWSRSLRNKRVSFSVRAYHDAGINLNYTVEIRRSLANADFSAPVLIATSDPINVPTNTDTTIKFENVNLGDFDNGIGLQIEVKCSAGAVAAKNFYTTDWTFVRGAKAIKAEPRLRNENMFAAQVAYATSFNSQDLAALDYNGAVEFNAGANAMVKELIFPRTMERVPTVTLKNPNSAASGTWRDLTGPADVTVTAGDISLSRCKVTGTTTAGRAIAGHFILDSRL